MTTKVSYFPGCSLEGTAREYNESVHAIARTLSFELAELPDWSCCGSSSAHATNEVLAAALPARNLEIADKEGLDLVTPCAACYHRLKFAEKELKAGRQIEGMTRKFEGKFQVKHMADFVWENIGEKAIAGKVKKPLKDLKVVPYYGCLVVRPPRITDAKNPEDPQSLDKILKTIGTDLKSWSYKTECCGGSLILTRPDIARALIQKLLDMAIEAGADGIVTGCPMCFSNLDNRQGEVNKRTGKNYSVPVFYFSELMGLAFGDPDAGKWFKRHIVDPRPLLKRKGLI